MNFNVTTPDDKLNVEYQLNLIINALEKQFKNEEDNEAYYHLVVSGEYPRNVLDQVEEIYQKAGWSKAECKTSSENGERGGLTGLKLWR
jgi:hypothetical protein